MLGWCKGEQHRVNFDVEEEHTCEEGGRKNRDDKSSRTFVCKPETRETRQFERTIEQIIHGRRCIDKGSQSASKQYTHSLLGTKLKNYTWKKFDSYVHTYINTNMYLLMYIC